MRSSASLNELLRGIPYQVDSTVPEIEISGVVADSRKVQAGNLFVAVSGETADGHNYLSQAIAGGAAVVMGTQPISGLAVPYIRVRDSRALLAHLAAGFFDYPARNLTVIGVTGTDGKTTTCNLIYKTLEMAGMRAGMISTVNAVIGEEVLDTGFHVTTPDAPDVQRYLAMMVDEGLTHVVLEVTSHGLAQGRVDGCEFDIGVLTNITHEHLDYHGSFAEYRAAKARLFQGLSHTVTKASGNPRLAVLNRDDESYSYLSSLIQVEQVGYGLSPQAELSAKDIRYQAGGMQFVVEGQRASFPVFCPLLGDFNVSNCLAAIGATWLGLRIEPGMIQEAISSVENVPGRMERIEMGQDFTTLVDFAHTPNALRNALETARRISSGRVIVVFGSAGLRDRQKRRMMPEIAARLADLSIITAEDPRTESLEDILEEMAQSATSAGGQEGKTFWRVPDRAEAIHFAVSQARPGEVVIVCGKGHEQSMCFGEIEYAWDDRIAMRAALAELLGAAGSPMPELPTKRQ